MTEQPHHDAPGDAGGPPPPPPPAAGPPAPDPVLAAGPIAYVDGGPVEFNRRAMLLSTALGRGLRRATWTAAIVAAVVAIGGSLLLGTAPAIVVALVSALLGAGLGTAAGIVAMGSPDRRAFETFSWLGRRELDRFTERTGSAIPTSPAAVRQWLVDHPPTAPFALARVELLAAVNELEQAQRELAAIPAPATLEDAVEQATLRRHVRYIATRVLDDSELDALEPRLDPTSPTGLELRAARATGETRRRLDLGIDTWRDPLVDLRPALPGAFAVTVRDTWRKLASALFLVSLAAGLVISMAH